LELPTKLNTSTFLASPKTLSLCSVFPMEALGNRTLRRGSELYVHAHRSCCVLCFLLWNNQNTSRRQRECFGIFLDFLGYILFFYFFGAISNFMNTVKNMFTSYICFLLIHPIPIYLYFFRIFKSLETVSMI